MSSFAGFGSLLGAFVSIVTTRGRLIGALALGGIAVAVAISIGLAGPTDPTEAGIELVNLYGLGILAPIVTLLVASATIGDPVEDSTLVYLWFRPIGRGVLALAAGAATALVTIPVVVVPLAIAAAASGAGAAAVTATVVAGVLAVVGYIGPFVLLGAIAKRALAWGLLYIVIWEGFIARAGTASSQLSVQYYARSALAEISGVDLRLSGASFGAAIAVPLIVAAVGLALVGVRLRRMSVA